MKPPPNMTSRFSVWLAALANACTKQRNCLVTCPKRNIAVALHSFIIHHCAPRTKSAQEWEDEVALITGTQVLPLKLKNSEDFIATYSSFSVAICTSVIESGVSFPNHFTYVFSYCSTGPLTYPVSVQLTKRVKNADDIFLFVEKGKPFTACHEVARIKSAFPDTTVSNHTMTSLLTTTFATLQSEIADVWNNNDVLWIYGRDPTIVNEDGIGSLCDLDVVTAIVTRIEASQNQSRSRVSNRWAGSSHSTPCTQHERTDLPGMAKILSKEFWRMRLADAHGLMHLIRYPNDDNSILKALQSIYAKNSIAMSAPSTSRNVRKEQSENIGEPCVALHRCLSKIYRNSGKKRFEMKSFSTTCMSFNNTIPINALLFLQADAALLQMEVPHAENAYENIKRVLHDGRGTSERAKIHELWSYYNCLEYATECMCRLVGVKFPKQQDITPTVEFLKSFLLHMHQYRHRVGHFSALFPACFTPVLHISLEGKKHVKAVNYLKLFLSRFTLFSLKRKGATLLLGPIRAHEICASATMSWEHWIGFHSNVTQTTNLNISRLCLQKVAKKIVKENGQHSPTPIDIATCTVPVSEEEARGRLDRAGWFSALAMFQQKTDLSTI